jgi:hypothetical protein
MRATSIAASSLLVAGQALASVAPRQPYAHPTQSQHKQARDECASTTEKIAPKVLIISMVRIQKNHPLSLVDLC